MSTTPTSPRDLWAELELELGERVLRRRVLAALRLEHDPGACTIELQRRVGVRSWQAHARDVAGGRRIQARGWGLVATLNDSRGNPVEIVEVHLDRRQEAAIHRLRDVVYARPGHAGIRRFDVRRSEITNAPEAA